MGDESSGGSPRLHQWRTTDGPDRCFFGLFGLAAAAGGSTDDSGQADQWLSDCDAQQERAAQRESERTQREYERQLYSPPPVGEKTNVP